MEKLVVGFVLWFVLGVVVALLWRITVALNRIAEAQESLVVAAVLPHAVALGHVDVVDLIKVDVPDSPSEDM